MPELRSNDRPRISLEQLLALKRSERPDPTFWEGFERELHRRQLASVVSRPAWYTRFARGMVVGLRRATPVAVAGAAAVAGFLVLQRPGAQNHTTPETLATVTAENIVPDSTAIVAQNDPQLVAHPESAAVADVAEPRLESSITSKPRFVVHEFVAASTPARSFVSVTSPNTFSSPAYDASLQMVQTLTMGAGYRAGPSTEAGRF